MENVERKRREVLNKNYVGKLRKKPQKSIKNKTRIGGRKCCKLAVQRPFKGLTVKDRRGVDGMFFKGLRTQYVTRETLNQVNEARRKEDINKIIDIGRVFFQKGELPLSPGSTFHDSQLSKSDRSCTAFAESSTDSSISPPFPAEGAKQENAARQPHDRRKNLHLEKELRAFSLKYEATVDAHILSKLPGNGVLEDAVTALRNLHKAEHNEEPERDYAEVEDCIVPRSFPVAEERFCEGFISPENTLENCWKKQTEVENANHPSCLTLFDNDDETESGSVIEFQAKGFEKPAKEFSIATPPIQFYRRNMF